MSFLRLRRKFHQESRSPVSGSLIHGPRLPVVNNISPPTAPVITASDISSSVIRIALTTPSTAGSGIASYNIERSANGTTGWSQLSPNVTFPYDDTGLTASTTYFYRSRATDNNGNVGSYSANTSDTTQASGGAGAPVPGGNIVFDTRAGGAESYQTLTTHAQMLSRWDANRFSGGATGFFEPNVDGAGTNARAVQWVSGTEQEGMVNLESHSNIAPASGWYVQFKTRFGRISGGAGTGTVGQFTLGGSNAHQKLFIMWTSQERYYIAMRPTECKFSIDGTSWSSNFWSENPYDFPGVIQTITCYVSQASGIVRAWRNDTQVLNQTGLSTSQIGPTTAVLNSVEETITCRIPDQSQVQYIWDTVIWYP